MPFDTSARPSCRLLIPATLLLLLAVAVGSPPSALARTPLPTLAHSWHAQASRISEGQDSAARAAAITGRLDAMEITWQAQAFEQDGKTGRNLIAELGGPEDAPILLLGAHYDRVAVGHGANDNASGVAAVLELAALLKAQPLAAHRVQLAFWDLEELGLLGAKAWVATPGQERPALYVNFDVFGWGNTLWMMAPDAEQPLVQALASATAARGIGFSPGQAYPPTDHLAFLKAGWPAVSFSLVGSDEVGGILAVFAGQKPEPAPKVMQIIHSERDVAAELDASHMEAALLSIEAGLRAWDAAQPGR